ncbi:MAG: PepSY domain-containing protein [Proteobacteria bacterium]|nr:PepSY domain-containing protein [Pseudomonadota bacterium]
MNKKLMLRKIHRYVALLVSLQLLAWTIGGIWFSWNDIEDIRGNHLRNADQPELAQPLVSTQVALNKLSDFEKLESIQVINFLNQPAYRIQYNEGKTALVNAITGEIIPEISKQQAIDIAKQNTNFEAEIESIELITETGKHHEYRGGTKPAWAITYDYSSSPTFYISTELGTLTSVRHTSWRIFDFFWMLHTMDYIGRDDFGNWLIKIFSLIALATAISGIVLFFISRRKKIKK